MNDDWFICDKYHRVKINDVLKINDLKMEFLYYTRWIRKYEAPLLGYPNMYEIKILNSEYKNAIIQLWIDSEYKTATIKNNISNDLKNFIYENLDSNNFICI